MTAPVAAKDLVTRAEVEDFLYHEAALLDEWRLDAWQDLLADDACYYVPSNDASASSGCRIPTVTRNIRNPGPAA